MSRQHEKAPTRRQGSASNVSAPSQDAVSSMSNSDLLSALGGSVSMPGAVQAKMEKSFGMSMSDVSLFESPLVSDNGAEAVASGNKIAFAPGRMNFTSTSGQELLGHELSHVAAQKRGEVSGSGFVKNNSLEQRADLEGSRAARGESVFGGKDK